MTFQPEADADAAPKVSPLNRLVEETLKTFFASDVRVTDSTVTWKHRKTNAPQVVELPSGIEPSIAEALASMPASPDGELFARAALLKDLERRVQGVVSQRRTGADSAAFLLKAITHAFKEFPSSIRQDVHNFDQRVRARAKKTDAMRETDDHSDAARIRQAGEFNREIDRIEARKSRMPAEERARQAQALAQSVHLENMARLTEATAHNMEIDRMKAEARAKEQQLLAEAARERKIERKRAEILRNEAERQALGLSERTAEEIEDVRLLHATYRAKWIASGGHPDPSSFLGVPEGMRKWAMDADANMRKNIDDPGSVGNVYGTGHELFLGVEIKDQRWFDARVIRIAAVDDYSNSLDLALEFPYDPELGIYPRLAIDFTTAVKQDVLDHKLEKQGRGTNVNFFRSEEETRDGRPFEGRVEDLPIVILGVDGKVLAEVGAALRRGETIGPDHPIKMVLLRQAVIQVGLQIKELAAKFMGNALRNRPSDRRTLEAVRAYSEGFQSGGDFLQDVSAIRDILRTVPADGMDYYLGKRATNRFRNLLSIHRSLERQIASTGTSHPAADEMMRTIRLSQVIRQTEQRPSQTKISPPGEIFLTRRAGSAERVSSGNKKDAQECARRSVGIGNDSVHEVGDDPFGIGA